MKEFDYSSAGAYYITLCSFERNNIFGTIENGQILLNECGEIIKTEWLKTPEIRSEIELDEYVIMPNHFHGIIWIDRRGTMHRAPTECTLSEYEENRGTMHRAPTNGQGTNEGCINGKGTKHRAPTVEQFGKPTSNTIPTIIRGFKSSVTKQFNILRNNPGIPIWQRNYYEHVIRDDRDLLIIRQYIRNNPQNWEEDENCQAVKYV